MTVRRPRGGGLPGLLLLCLPLGLAAPIPGAQAQDPVVDAKGFQTNRDYFSQAPFEHIDTCSGSLVLTFTDLVLPGNAGRALRFTRVFHHQVNALGGSAQPWRCRIAGLPMTVTP